MNTEALAVQHFEEFEPGVLTAVGSEGEQPSLADDLRLLADEAKELAQAEFSFQKSRAAYVGTESRNIALLLIVAVVLVFFALVALVVGTVIALGPLLGPWGAMAAVTIALLAIAGFCAFRAKGRTARMMAILSDGGTSA